VHKQRSFKQQNNDNAAMGNNFGSSGSNTVALADNAGNPNCRGSPGCISTTFPAPSSISHIKFNAIYRGSALSSTHWLESVLQIEAKKRSKNSQAAAALPPSWN
jgi:hypothetical protein